MYYESKVSFNCSILFRKKNTTWKLYDHIYNYIIPINLKPEENALSM